MATTKVAVAPMKAAQISKPGADFEIVEREIPKPGAGQVRIKVQACGVCHSDMLTEEGGWPGIEYPRVPGHEVAGIIDEVGAGVTDVEEGATRRRGLARRAGQHVSCVPARRFSQLPEPENSGHQLRRRIPAIHGGSGGGAGGDTGQSKRRGSGAAALRRNHHLQRAAAQRRDARRPGRGAGHRRSGHLGIQFANKFGYKVAAIGRGPENAALAKKLGANVYIDSKATNAAEALQKLGGAQVILATAPSSKAMSELIDGLGPNGKLMVVGATFDPIEVTPVQLITGSRTIQGWASGTPADSEDTLQLR